MNVHINEERLADAAFGDSELATAEEQHVSACRECAAAFARYSRLRARVTALPAEGDAIPAWSSFVEKALTVRPVAMSASSTRYNRQMMLAAVAAVALIAFALGRVTAVSAGGANAGDGEAVRSPTELVQEKGTEYLEAVAALGKDDTRREQRQQDYQVTLATLHGASLELERQGFNTPVLNEVSRLLSTEREDQVAVREPR